ncbi:MAG: SPASM domain-containing protein [Methylocystis sp.]
MLFDRLDNEEELFLSTHMAIASAEPTHLTPAMARVNERRGFDSKDKVSKLLAWISELQDMSGFRSIFFLEGYLTRYPKEVAAMIVLALEYQKLGDYERAVEVITKALSTNRFDLHAAETARMLFASAKGTAPNERAVAPAIPHKANVKHTEALEDIDRWLQSRYCDMPFSNLDTMPDGNVFMCCGDWLPIPIGNIYENTAEEIWDSEVAREIRSSIVDKSFRYCNKLTCQSIANRALPPAPECAPSVSGSDSPPSRLVLSHDNSCNLSCPSCRSELILAKKDKQDQLNGLLDKVFMPLLRKATNVRISGSGDPFASNHYRTLLKTINRTEFPELCIDLHTNAQLFDDRAWEELQMDKKDIGSVEISIDAATSETYDIVRRGGSFTRLLKNLEFIKGLRESGAFGRLVFSFVVQRDNYEEMPEFVLLAERYGADFVDFRMILNWGIVGIDEFNRKFIGSPNHPEYYEYRKILDGPELKRNNVRVPAN